MQAVIMAGGKGTRLASVTGDMPKPMVPVNGKPLLEYQIENLKENGIGDIILSVGYLGEKIREYFGDGRRHGVRITYYREEKPLGTAGVLPIIKERLEDTFFLIFGDLFLDISYRRFYKFHKEKGAVVSLFAHPNSHPYDSDLIVAEKGGKVTGWHYKDEARSTDYANLVNAGVYAIEKDAVGQIPLEQAADLEKDVVTKLIAGGRVFAYRSTEYVKDIGTPERLEKVARDCQNGICAKRNLKYKQKCIFLDRDGTINKFAGFLNDAEKVELEEGAAEAVRMINESGYLAVVITNQPVVARGECSFGELAKIHNRIEVLLGREGAYLDGLYFCPHHPDSGFEGEIPELKFDCGCRKPKTGMVEQAAIELNIDVKNSWFIGDTGVDVETGRNAGVHTVLLKSGDQRKSLGDGIRPEMEAENLPGAVAAILKTG